jgi:hypothetical protein
MPIKYWIYLIGLILISLTILYILSYFQIININLKFIPMLRTVLKIRQPMDILRLVFNHYSPWIRQRYPPQIAARQISVLNEKNQTVHKNHKRQVTQLTKKTVAARQQWKCGQCGNLLDETYEVDHIIPLYQGGTNQIENLMALDPHCHRKKTNSDRGL